MRSIVEEFVCVEDCPTCLGQGIVCEDHLDKAWGDGDGCCGGAGAPCPHVKCKWACSATIAYVPEGHEIEWPCGTRALVRHAEAGRRFYVDELRALHRSAILANAAADGA